jgi:hypothetical protein
MGLFDMSPLGWIIKVTDFSQTSLENTMGTVKEVHQAIIEIPINVAQELGFPEESATVLKDTHRQILDHLQGGICDACGEVNQYIVKQAKAVNQLFNFVPNSVDPTIVKLQRKKGKAARKKLS